MSPRSVAALALLFAAPACGPREAPSAGPSGAPDGAVVSSESRASAAPHGTAYAAASTAPAASAARGATIERDDEGRLVLTADAETPYGEVVAALDAALASQPGDFRFAPPRGVTVGRTPDGKVGGASPSLAGALGRPPQYVLTLISKTKLSVGEGGGAVLSYASGSLGAEGLPLAAKPDGAQSLFVVPLADALRKEHARVASVKPAAGGPALLLAADETTPYRVLFEVLYTASQIGLTTFRLLVKS
ncbi:MAG: hypothetical protein IPM79_32255 [Polyangiaceae bacterium]|jgi:biopolymer transport protein ExbD|nr:hypothetical protein [Polyangiaceae bacterium]MBK8942155.1 hypothetical protein [Polyangiaceae bacterium]